MSVGSYRNRTVVAIQYMYVTRIYTVHEVGTTVSVVYTAHGNHALNVDLLKLGQPSCKIILVSPL